MTQPSQPAPSLATRLRLDYGVTRTALVAVAALLLFLVHSHFDRQLRLRFDLWVDKPGLVDVYYALPEHGYDARLHFMQQAQPQQWTTFEFVIPSYRPVTEIRIDPMRTPGAFQLRSVQFASDWAHVVWDHDDLLRHQLGSNHLQSLDDAPATDATLSYRSTGGDPYLRFRVPAEAQQPPGLARSLPLGAALAFKVALAWGLLETLLALMRRWTPAAFDRLRRSFTRGMLLPLLVCSALTWHASGKVSPSPVLGDGIQNLLIAYNLFKHKTFSHIASSNPVPTDFREPLPPAVIAAHLYAFAGDDARAEPFSQFRAGRLTRFVKLSNLYWVFLGLLSAWLLTRRLSPSRIGAPLAATALAYGFFYQAGPQLNTLYTELQTAALLTLSSWALLRGIQLKRFSAFALAGACLGLLALTKASFLPIGIVAMSLLLLILLLARQRLGVSRARAFGWVSLAGAAAVLTIMPWIARNLVQLDSPRISDRGGLILHGRAVLNNMSDDEVIGLVYENSPLLYRRLVQGTAYGASADNSEFMRGGRWQRINRGMSDFIESDREAILKGLPDQAISFHAWAGANYTILLNELKAQGNPYPEETVDKRRRAEAIQMLAERPWRHLCMTFPFFWHGFWGLHKTNVSFISLDTQDLIVEVLNLLGGLALIGGVAIGLLGRRPQVLAATILPFGLMAFYAFISHSIPRYMSPAHPQMLVMLVLAAQAVLAMAWRRTAHMDKRRKPPSLA